MSDLEPINLRIAIEEHEGQRFPVLYETEEPDAMEGGKFAGFSVDVLHGVPYDILLGYLQKKLDIGKSFAEKMLMWMEQWYRRGPNEVVAQDLIDESKRDRRESES
jgi:hypothetical protein